MPTLETIAIEHPDYVRFKSAWELMRDSVDGEDDVKRKGTKYLPMKTGTASITNPADRDRVYKLYMTRAEFPEIVAPTIRGAVGVMLAKPAKVDLPPQLESLRESATSDGLTLDMLHIRIANEIMTTGRYGLLPSIAEDGTPYLAGYTAEDIKNWEGNDYVVLDESGIERNRETGEWETVIKLRECSAYDGVYVSRVYTLDPASRAGIGEDDVGLLPNRQPLGFMPFVFIGSMDLTPSPDDIPLYGLAKLAMRIYRMDADFSFSLHMTSEPTPVAIGFDDPASAIRDGMAPKTLGSSVLWVLPKGGDAKYLEFSGPGIEKQAQAIQASYDRAAQYGAQVISQGQSAESGEALRLRAASQTATLTTIAKTSAAGLEKALRNLAIWVGADPEQVVVTPNLQFFDRKLTPQEVLALVQSWQAGAISHRTVFDNLQAGGIIPEEITYESEGAQSSFDEFLPPGAQQSSAEGAGF